MNVQDLRTVLHDRAESVDGTRTDRLDELFRRIRTRRRRRAAAVAAAAIAVVLTAFGAAALTRGDDRSTPPPVDRPTQTHIVPPTASPVRKIVYSDTTRFTHTTGTIHFGDRVVNTSDGFVHMDMTDDGFLYTTRGGRVWFSDGGRPEQIGTACGLASNEEVSTMALGLVMTANAGGLAAWFDCTRAAPATLVVYDTGLRRTVARRQIGVCGAGPALVDSCTLAGLIGGKVYFDQGIYAGSPSPEYVFAVTTGRLSATTSKFYAADLRSQPRGLVVGDTWQSGTATDGIGQDFRAVGSRLAAWWRLPNGEQVLMDSFDTGTRQALRLSLPSGYHAKPAESFTLFEWLDDDTVALVSGGLGDGAENLLTCHLSDGRCAVTVPRDHEHDRRIVPHLGLPG